MGKYSGLSFEQAFGVKPIAANYKKNHNMHRHDPRPQQRLTASQNDFCRFVSIDIYLHESPPRRELIVLTEEIDGACVLKEVRRPDFSLIKRYKAGLENALKIVDGMLPLRGMSKHVKGYQGNGYYRIIWTFANSDPRNVCALAIDSGFPVKMLRQDDIIECLHSAAISTGAGQAAQLSALHDTLDKQLAEAGEDIFVYELLQNANDYPYDDVVNAEFRIVRRRDRRGYLVFSHTGAPFTARNVAAICSANDQDKSDNVNAIGYKGIGFKTVFRYNDRAEIRSGGFGFAFDHKTAEEKDGYPWRTIPRRVNSSMSDKFRVEIKLFPRDEDKLGNGPNGYSELLRKLFRDERPLLFIPRIGTVKLFLDDWTNPIIRTAQGGVWCKSESFLVEVDADVRQRIDRELKDVEHCRIPPKYRHLDKTAVTFACRKNGRRLIKESASCLYCYLPAHDADWGFHFLMNTDMIPNGKRTDIEYSIDVNKYFARVAGECFCEWIRQLLECGDWDYDSIFDLIPDFEECVKNREKIAAFIREFQVGFESNIRMLKIPDSTGNLVEFDKVSDDVTGVLAAFGDSLWKRFHGVGKAVHKSLRGSQSYKRFVDKYKDKLGIKRFGWDDLCGECRNAEIQSWLKNPCANSEFVKFLMTYGKLPSFKDVAIFLDNHGELGRSAEMYQYGEDVRNIERWLPKFAQMARYLSPKVIYHEMACDVKFRIFGPRTFLKESILSDDKIFDSRNTLREIETAKGFWSFIAHYRLNGSKERFADDYKLLGSIPFVTESGDVVDSFVSQEFSVYVRDGQSNTSILNFQWFNTKVRFVSQEYFTGTEGSAIKNLLTDSLFADKKRLVGKIEFRDVLVNVFAKFKDEILADMKAATSDMGTYSFLSDCVANNCVNMKWLQEQITKWPVEDVGSKLVERVGKHVWYCCDQLFRILSSKWMDGSGLVVLSQKYDAQRALFDILGAKDFEKVGFGEFFREEIFGHLNKNCDVVDLVAFHEYMCGQVADGRLTSDKQLAAWKKSPVIVDTTDGTIQTEGCSDILISKEHLDVQLEIVEGHLPATAKVLSACMLTDKATEEYWKKLGFQLLDGRKILQKTIEAYLDWQNGIKDGEELDEEFKSRHLKFVMSMANRCVNVALLQGIKLLDAKGTLVSPAGLVLPQEYSPECEFQRYGCDLRYVSAGYHDGSTIEGMASFLRDLGVRDEFSSKDVPLLREKAFCQYFWTEYSKSHEINDEIIKAMNVAPCVLDRAGVVRKPCELYSIALEQSYVSNIDGADVKLPLLENVNVTLYEKLNFRKSLTASDAVTFLLSDADGSRYAFRGRALKWIDDGALSSSDIERYRNDEHALWRNAKNGQMSHIRDLCVIKSRNANRVRSHFGNNEHVVDLRGTDNGEQHVARETIERSLSKLRVMLIDNALLEPMPCGKKEDPVIKSEIKVRMLVLLATSVEASWSDEYVKKVSLLEACRFYLCDSFEEVCTGFDCLKSERGTFSQKGNEVYYVGGWQGKRVYLDVIRFLKEKLCLSQYADDDLKEAFDTDGGLRGLAQKILDDHVALMDDPMFVEQLQNVNNDLKLEIDNERILRAQTNGCVARECFDQEEKNVGEGAQPILSREETAEEEGSILTEQAQPEIHEHQEREENNADEIDERRRKLGEKYGVLSDEEYALLKLFDDGLSIDERQDQSKLACIRLVRHLEGLGLEPSMYGCRDTETVIRKLYVESTERKGPNIDVNTGKKIHVISAIGGLAYLPPKWWNFLTAAVDEMKEVCIMTGARNGDFKFVRHPSDVGNIIDENAVIVKVSGRTAEERMRIISDMFKGGVVMNSPGRVYGILKMRNVGDGFDWAFINKILPTIEADESTDSMTNGEY